MQNGEKKFTIDSLPELPFRDKSRLGWEEATVREEPTLENGKLLVYTLPSGIDIPVFVDVHTQEILLKEIGVFKHKEGFDLSSGWHVGVHDAGFSSSGIFTVNSLINREITVEDKKLDSGYLVDLSMRDLRWHYGMEDQKEKLRVDVGTNLHTPRSEGRQLGGIISSKSKLTGHKISFSFDFQGELFEISMRKEPLAPVIIQMDDKTPEEIAEVGQEVAMSLFDDQFVDMQDFETVAELCGKYLGVTPKKGTPLAMNLRKTMATLIKNILSKNPDDVQTNTRGLIAFDSFTVAKDVRMLSS